VKILVVEDEKKVAAFIRRGLVEQSYSVDTAHDGVEGERMARGNAYDAIVLDLMLPRKSGFALCRAIRAFDARVPILILTALDSTEDKLQGLEAGADEYLPKPFEFRELLAHLRSLLRRRESLPSSGLLRVADLQMDLITRKVSRGGQNLALTAREFALLEYFLRNLGRVITRTEIAQKVWETSFDSESNVIDVYVSFLRKKIDKGFPEKLIHTLVGVGYVLRSGETA
jgi:two-component system copper resistance phosphate regulon response regulator CusR